RARNELTRVRHARPEAPLKQRPDAMSKVALAHARNRRIDGHDQRGIARRFRARDRGFRHRAATRDIELIPERTARAFADFFESSARKRGQDVARAGGARFTRGVDLASRIEHAAEADRSEHEGKRQRSSKHGCAQIARRDRHTLARPERHIAKGANVLLKRDLVFGAAVDVREDDGWQAPLREPPEVFDVDDTWEGDGASKARFGSHGLSTLDGWVPLKPDATLVMPRRSG